MSDLTDRGKRGLNITDAEFEGNTSGWIAVDYKVLVKKDKVEETTELYFCNVCDTMVKEEDIENLEVHAACKTELDSASIPNQELGVWENDSK